MNATYSANPSYAVVPSPRPRRAADGLTLVALHTAIRFSALFAKFTARRWGLRHLAESAEHVAAELIARAVETTGNPDPNPRYLELGELHPIGIRVSAKGYGLLIEVWDRDPTLPQAPHLDNHLLAVATISQQWNCYQTRSGGKVIWVKLSLPAQRRASQPLPQRTAGRYSYSEAKTLVTPIRDIKLMQRVLDGLHRLDTRQDRHSGQL